MAIIEKATFKYERKFNLGDFNSLALSVMPTVVIEDGDDINEVMKGVWEMCRKNIQHAAEPIVRSGNGGVTKQELFLGLPIEESLTIEEVQYKEGDNAN